MLYSLSLGGVGGSNGEDATLFGSNGVAPCVAGRGRSDVRLLVLEGLPPIVFD